MAQGESPRPRRRSPRRGEVPLSPSLDNPADAGAAIERVLKTGDPAAKAEAAKAAAAVVARATVLPPNWGEDWPSAPQRPARPQKPELVAPGKVERRRLGSEAGRAALLHALAHIEFNAIDLAFDMALRFAPAVSALGLDALAFVKDWASVGGDEARHFLMICERMSALGCRYGDLPAHDGLWKSADATADDALARLAVAPMALEARGLDVTPGLAEKLARAGDAEGAAILGTIYRDEIGHVSAGVFWFEAICERRNLQPGTTFRKLISERLAGGLRPPFNEGARAAAGLGKDFYDAAI